MKTIEKLTKTQMKLAVLKDALKQLDAKTFSCKGDGYLHGFLPKTVDLKSQMQKHMPKLKKCKVCAKGGLLLGYINKFNNVTVNQLSAYYSDDNSKLNISTGNYFIVDTLKKVFTVSQLNLIEAVFEDFNCYLTPDQNTTTPIKASDYIPDKITDRNERFRFILKSMIKNDGTLKKLPKTCIK